MEIIGQASHVANSFGGTSTPMPEIPAFSGEDAFLWVCRVDQYFNAIPTMNERDKFRVATSALKEPVLNWFLDWKKYTSTNLTWSSFKDAVLKRFQPEAIHYPCLPLLNLRQTGTVAEYCYLFQTLSCSQPLQHLKVTDEISMAIFLNGLREDLRVEPRLQEEKSLKGLMEKAKLIEEEIIKAEEDAVPKLRPNPLLEFWGEIAGRKVIILVATGSSDNRIAKRVVEELGLPVCESDELFDFGFGPPEKSEGLCKGVKVKIHKNLEITRDFFVFESLGGKDDIVLGSAWVRSLGCATMFYEGGLTIKFEVAGKSITLKGDPSLTAPPDEVRISFMRRLKI